MKITACKIPPDKQLLLGSLKFNAYPWPSSSLAEKMWDEDDFEDADYIIAPFSIGIDHVPNIITAKFETELAQHFPFVKKYPEKCIFIDGRDMDEPYPFFAESIFLKPSANFRYHQIIPIPFPVWSIDKIESIESCPLDIFFQGYIEGHPIRSVLARSHRAWRPYETLVIDTGKFYWSLDPFLKEELAGQYIKFLKKSKFILCPRGRGLNSFRFFEALAYGRIPILISDALRLPLESEIPYNRFSIRVPEGYCSQVPDFVDYFLATYSLEEASLLGRHIYDEYFRPDKFRSLIERSLMVRNEK